LTVRDVGMYAGVPWGEPGAAMEPGSMLDRTKDLNFTVASINVNDDTTAEDLAGWRQHAANGRAQGKWLLPRIHFWDGPDRYEGPMRDVAVYRARLDLALSNLNLDDLYAICLAEENVNYAGRPEVLTALYHHVKERYDVAVYQWYSPGGAVPGPPWVPADGWIIDWYGLRNPAFRRYVQKYLITGVPLIVMPYAEYHTDRPEWSEEQWASLEDQLQVCLEYNLPVAWYWCFGTQGPSTGCYFPLQTGTFMDRVNERVLKWIEQVRDLPEEALDNPSADVSEGQVLEIAPDAEGRLTYHDPFTTSQCLDDASVTGFRDLLWRGDDLAARGFHGRPTQASLTYHFAGDFAAVSPEAMIQATTAADLKGKVTLAFSTDGKTWAPTATHPSPIRGGESGMLRVTTANDPRFASVKEFWLRVGLSGDAGSDDGPPVRVDNLRIEAALQLPEKKIVQLNPIPDAPGQFRYEDDFQTRKYLYTAEVTHGEWLDWRRGQVSMHGDAPGRREVTLTWHVFAPEPVNRVKIVAENRANHGPRDHRPQTTRPRDHRPQTTRPLRNSGSVVLWSVVSSPVVSGQ